MLKKANFVLQVLRVIIWIIFIGLCIISGTLLFNFLFSLFRPVAAYNLYQELNLANLYQSSFTLYLLFFVAIILMSIAKASTFYILIRLLQKLDLKNPFHFEISSEITRTTYSILFAGIMGVIAKIISKVITRMNIETDMAESLWNDYAAYLMMSAVVFLIAAIFRRGVELQNENDLTI